jgi:hypothetical protein
MTIIPKTHLWPTVVVRNPATGDYEETPRSFGSVVSDGIARMMYKHGKRPTSLLVGPTAKHHLSLEIADMPAVRMKASEIKELEDRNGGLAEYMGMTIHWTEDEGLHILND